MFISPSRSELKAMAFPSGDQAPLLSTRVVLTNRWGGPADAPAEVMGSRQRSELIPRTANASRLPLGATVGSTSSPAPVVSCCGAPSGVPLLLSSVRQRFNPPPREEEK